MLERIQSLFYEVVEIDEGFVPKSKGKPDTEGGKYIVRPALGRDPKNPRRHIPGWTKTKKKNVISGTKGGMTKSQRKQAAKKAARTRKANPAKQKKAAKKAVKTRKINKR